MRNIQCLGLLLARIMNNSTTERHHYGGESKGYILALFQIQMSCSVAGLVPANTAHTQKL